MQQEILDSKKVIQTIERLNIRIEERFPKSGLLAVGRKLQQVGSETDTIMSSIAKPNLWYRLGVGIFMLVVLIALIYAVTSLSIDIRQFTLDIFVQIVESTVNDLVLLGAAVIFLVSMETRTKRKKIISSINRLRSIAHVIDAHQLTKDPDTVALAANRTAHSPERTMTPYQLGRYLDYCSEMLSLTGKVGFLYVQKFDDSVAVRAANDLENLTTDLSRKIWQKIMILNRNEGD
jgi:hypothetical protein